MAKVIADKSAPGKLAARLDAAPHRQHEQAKIHVEHFQPSEFMIGTNTVRLTGVAQEVVNGQHLLRVDIEVKDRRGRIVDHNGPHYIQGPRLMVPDGTFHERTLESGRTTLVHNFREDPTVALQLWAEHHLSLMGIK